MTQRHQVVVNDEDQYSLWPADRQPPDGWRAEGFAGSKEECLSHIDQVWRDMRPRSVRLRQEDAGGDTGGDTAGDAPGGAW
ncbi:MbtH family protein [Nonomuraea sp. B10E15]|uniref:MbtH family protein n=1 Tax=Nonomuraea sp. B10E15 TaxID=3153560 RepID=UPI00325C8A00